jgi:HEAT repeat protein
MTRSIPAALGVALLLAAPPVQADSPKERAQKLMKTLAKDKDPQKRADAAESLGDMGAWDAVPALAAALKDPSADVRIAATYGLTKLKEHAKDAVPALKEVLADPNSLVRYNAVVALQNLDAATPGELMPALAPLLADRDKEIRENVLKMLFNVGLEDEPVRDTLIGALELGPVEVRREVATALWHDELDPAAGPWVREFASRLVQVASRETDAKVRRDIVVVLRDVRRPIPPDVIRFLTAALDDPDLEVASAAAATLNGAEEDRTLAQKAVAHIVKRLETGATAVEKVRAVKLLESLVGYRETFIPAVARALASEKDPAVRAQAARTLGDLRGDEGIAPLLKALGSDSDRNVRAAAATSLAEFRSYGLARAGQLEAVLAALRAAAQDGADDNLRVAAENALEALQK